MAIQIPADLEASIQGMVERGDFPDADAVIREAMLLLDAQEEQLAPLRAKLQIGLDQLDRGEAVPFTPALMAKIQQDAEERFRRGETPNPDVCP